MKLNYKSTELFYTTKGTGNPLVLLHGFLESTKIWDPFIEKLSGKRQVICIDLPGHGKSGNISDIHTMELMADVVHEVLQHLKIVQASLVGHSMGGYVSLAFLEKFPGMTKSLVLMNSTPEEDSEEKKINRDRSISIVMKNKNVYINMAITNLLPPGNFIKFRTELDEIKNQALQMSKEGIIAALKGMKIRTNRNLVLKNFRNPKYIILGTKDLILNAETTQVIAKHCECQLILTEGGHLSYLENYTEIEEILYFID
ncbi:alpha/beta fold hydrolase [Gillisia sp. Q332]|uniref:alpha/beta fold hydrolase n=1 Tax=Gillisia xinjiangensis TaxID=3384765 RepID=UPI00391C1B4B